MGHGYVRTNVLTLDVSLKNDRLFHCMVYIPNQNINCSITFVYGFPQHFKEKKVWDSLINIKYSKSGILRVYILRRKKASHNVKLDMEKADNRLEWNFIIVVLTKLGLHPK